MITTEDPYICKIVNLLVSNFRIIFVWLTPLSQTKLMQNCSLVHWLSWLPVIHKQALEIKKVKHSDGKENSNFAVCWELHKSVSFTKPPLQLKIERLEILWNCCCTFEIRIHKVVEPIVFSYRAAKRKKIDTRIYHLGTISTSRQNWLDLGWCKGRKYD